MSGGGTVYEYQREMTARLERTERALSDARHQCEVMRRERDEARAEVQREKASATRGWQTADELHLTVRDLNAEVERLRAGRHTNGCRKQSAYNAQCVCGASQVEGFRNAVREKERLELEALQELDEARAEVERLRGELRTVAERQREACAEEAERQDRDGNGNCPWPDVLLTPLVTEEKP